MTASDQLALVIVDKGSSMVISLNRDQAIRLAKKRSQTLLQPASEVAQIKSRA